MSGAFAAAGSGESEATFTLSSTVRGERDLRRVSARVVGVPTAKAPKPSDVEADGKVEEVDIDKIRVGPAKLVRGRIARASRIVRNGVKADGDGVEPITVVKDGDGYVVVRGRGEHRVASLRLDGKTGKVPVKVVGRKNVAKKGDDDQPRDDHGRWTTGGAGGASRDKSGTWRGPSGDALSDADHARLNTLGTPPAWTDVRLNPDETGDLQVVGKDAKGRQQYLYSAEHSERAAAEKFARAKAFAKELPKIRERVAKDLADKNLSPKDREAANVLDLIDKTAFRVGSDAETGADVKAHGATTLEAKHVSVNGDDVSFKFIGKKGVEIEKTITDKRLAKEIATRAKAGGRLFDTTDATVRDYLHERDGDFKVKDYRTYHGTATALREIASTDAPTTKKEFVKAQKAVCEKVAAHLGNTPSVAKASYIDPAVWGKWQGKLMKRDPARDDDEIMADFFETVTYAGAEKHPYEAMPEIATSEDEPDASEDPGMNLVEHAKRDDEDDVGKSDGSGVTTNTEKRDAEMGMTDYELREAVGKAIRAAHGSCCNVLDVYPEAGMATFSKRPMNEMGYADYSPGSEMLMRATYDVGDDGGIEIGEPEEVEHHFKPMGKAGVGHEVEITLGWNEAENAHVVEGLEGDEAKLLKRELVETGAVSECRWNAAGDRIAFRLADERARGRDVIVKAYVEGEEVEDDGDSDGAGGESILRKAEVLEGTEELAKAAKKGIVTLKVYGPNEVDSQGEYATAEDIEKAAFEYLEKSRLVKINHRDPAPGCSVVESWIAKADWKIGEKVVKAGTWLVTMRLSKDAKKAFEEGRLTGVSMGGSCERE